MSGKLLHVAALNWSRTRCLKAVTGTIPQRSISLDFCGPETLFFPANLSVFLEMFYFLLACPLAEAPRVLCHVVLIS